MSALDSVGNFFVHNNGELTRIHTSLSCLDIAISSQHLSNNISWSVLENTHGSDHFLIMISLKLIKDLQIPPKKYFQLTRVNWGNFSDFFSSNIDSLDSSLSYLDHALNTCISFIVEAITHTRGKAPKVDGSAQDKRKHKQINAAWWDEECTALIDEKRESLRSFKLNLTMENLRAAKKSYSHSNKSLNKIKSTNFKSFIGSFNPNRSMVDNFSIIKKFRDISTLQLRL